MLFIDKKWVEMKNSKSVRYLLSLFLSAVFLFVIVSQMDASEKIGRPVRVVSLCFRNEGLDKIAKIIDKEGAKGTDIIVLPETWSGQLRPETLEGETIAALSKLAKKHNTYILSPIDRTDGKFRYNSAVLINREGRVVFVYDKVYPYWNEFDLEPPVTPGTNSGVVYDTDFGRIGIAICYDVNFPEIWQSLREKGAEVVFWPSAYSAGLQLQAYALLHHYYIVTSTYSKDCQVYDITGQRILDEKNDDITVARITLDLDRGIYHENFNMGKLNKLLKIHGNEVEKELYMPREEWFVLRAKKPGVSARWLAKEFEMEELTDYQNRSRKEIDKKRNSGFPRKLYLPE
jgi:predicted amidohydrolase